MQKGNKTFGRELETQSRTKAGYGLEYCDILGFFFLFTHLCKKKTLLSHISRKELGYELHQLLLI